MDRPHTLASIDNLANVLDSQSKYEEADDLHRQALEVKEKVLGVDHPSTLRGIVTNRRLDGLRLVLRATRGIAVCQVIRLRTKNKESNMY